MTWSDLTRISRSQHVLKSNVGKKLSLPLKRKLLLHKRKMYVTYGLVLCLVTLTDRRAGLLALANFLFHLCNFNTNDIQI